MSSLTGDLGENCPSTDTLIMLPNGHFRPIMLLIFIDKNAVRRVIYILGDSFDISRIAVFYLPFFSGGKSMDLFKTLYGEGKM